MRDEKKEIKKMHNRLKRKVPIKVIEEIGLERFRLITRMVATFESRYRGVFKFSNKDYIDFMVRVSKAPNLLNMLSVYLIKEDVYVYPTLTLKVPQIKGGKVKYDNITFKKLLRKEESKYYIVSPFSTEEIKRKKKLLLDK